MRRLLLFGLLIATQASSQAPRTLMEASHCSVERDMLPSKMSFPLRVGYIVDKTSFTAPEIFLVFVPIHTESSGLVIGLAPESSGRLRKYYINNNAGFVIRSGQPDFTPDAPLGGVATQAAILRGIHSVLRGKLYTVSRRKLEQGLSNVSCIGLNDPPNK